MNADDLHDLDRRGHAAAEDLHQVARTRPQPPFDPAASVAPAPVPLRPRTARRVLAVAAAVLALAAGAAVLSTQGDDDGTADEVVTDQLRGWELGTVPDGLELAGAIEGQREPGATGAGTLTAYGPAPEDPRVGVAAAEDWSLAELGASAEPFTVDGVTAADLGDFGLAPVAVVVDDPDAPGDGILAVSATLDREQLARLATATTVTDGVARIDEAALEDGWQSLTADPSGAFLLSATAIVRGAEIDARSVAYLEADPAGPAARSLTVTARPGVEDQLQLVRLTADEVEEVDLDGVPALLATQRLRGAGLEGRALRSITWQARPGELVQVASFDVEASDLLAAAASAQPLSEAAWADLVRRSDLGLLDTSGGPVIAQGTLDDGTPFALRYNPTSQSLDLNVAVDDDGAGSSGSATASGADEPGGSAPATRWIASSSVDVAGRTFDAGLVTDDVAFVSVRRDGVELVRIEAREPELDEQASAEVGDQLGATRWYAFERPEGAVELVLIRTDGSEGPAMVLDGPMVTETGPDGSPVTIVEGAPSSSTGSSSGSATGSGG
jgi:hypothetical protein